MLKKPRMEEENPFEVKNQIKDPTRYDGDIYNCALTIAICGILSAIAALVSILLTACSGEDMILIIVGGVSALCAAICVITEGLFYNYTLKNDVQDQFSRFKSYDEIETPFRFPYRNSSRARNWLKDAIKKMYNQAKDNLEAKYPAYKGAIPSWSNDLIGSDKTKDGTKYIFNYPSFDISGMNPHTVDFDLFDTIRFHAYLYADEYKIQYPGAVEGVIYAFYKNALTYVPVASMNFNVSKADDVKEKRRVCWKKSDIEYECKEVNRPIEGRWFGGVDSLNMWGVIQYMMLDEKKYYPIDKQRTDQVYVDYLFELPVAFYLMDYEEVKKEEAKELTDKTRFRFTKDNVHYNLVAEDYAKEAFDAYKKEREKLDDDFPIYWCKESPSNWDDAFKNEGHKCGLSPYSGEIENPLNVPSDKDHLEKAFAMANIGLYPNFVNKYFTKTIRSNYFKMANMKGATISIAVGGLVCQLFGIIFWTIGRFVKGSDN